MSGDQPQRRAGWREFVQDVVEDYCHNRGARTFTLKELMDECGAVFHSYSAKNKNVPEKVRQQLQELRKREILTFVDGRGTYTLRTAEVLRDEVAPHDLPALTGLAPERREYLIETFARNRGWVALARQHYGDYCLVPKCRNTFLTEAGLPYVEVHHLTPLCLGGEDALWNLSVVCAHHHRMAHFATVAEREKLTVVLRSKVETFVYS